MGKEPPPPIPGPAPPARLSWSLIAVAGSAAIGLALMVDQATRSSATYDEVTYLRVAAHWWRTGDQELISRMGSPVTFWKIQQAPTLWALDRSGRGDWIDRPIENQAKLLPAVRIGGLWTWLVALGVAANWARILYGPRAMAMASALFALGPNLLAHGALATMELPLVACTSAIFYGFWRFLRDGSRRHFWMAAAVGGLAMSCKFTTVLVPPILAMAWAVDLRRSSRPAGRIARAVVPGMVGFVAAMVAANLVVTGCATIPLSAREGDHPILSGRLSPGVARWASRLFEASYPQDWVGFATQVIHQRNGGPSYLMGERSLTGWAHYYPVTLAVKVPLAFLLLFAARAGLGRRRGDRDWLLPFVVGTFLLAAIVGSKRNYGVRYLLPIATPAIVWTSAMAEGRRWSRIVAGLGVAGMAASIGSIHPHELTYFNAIAGGPIGGRRILSDSNLDWGQGARSLARLQRGRPEFRDLTLFYFGDTDPAYYGVEGRRYVCDANRTPDDLPPVLAAGTKYLAVSASLQWGPWGPAGYFRRLDAVRPVCFTDDTTIAVYDAACLADPGGGRP